MKLLKFKSQSIQIDQDTLFKSLKKYKLLINPKNSNWICPLLCRLIIILVIINWLNKYVLLNYDFYTTLHFLEFKDFSSRSRIIKKRSNFFCLLINVLIEEIEI